jgi:hypothetical protein
MSNTSNNLDYFLNSINNISNIDEETTQEIQQEYIEIEKDVLEQKIAEFKLLHANFNAEKEVLKMKSDSLNLDIMKIEMEKRTILETQRNLQNKENDFHIKKKNLSVIKVHLKNK